MRLVLPVGLDLALGGPVLQLADGLLLLGEVLLAGFAVLAQFVDFLLEGVPRRLCGQERLAGSLDQLGDAALALGYFFQSKVGLLEGDQSVEVRSEEHTSELQSL